MAKVVVRLSSLLSLRGDLVIGVARDQLIIEGVATDRKHPLLRGLAERMFRHELGLMTVSAGVTESEISEMLVRLSEEPERTGRPLGRESRDVLNGLPHVRLHPLGFDKLQIRDADGPSSGMGAQCSHLWIMLAEAALAGEELDDEAGSDPEIVARAIDRNAGDAAFDEAITGYLLAIVRDNLEGGTHESEDLRNRVSDLISRLAPGTLSRLLHSMAGAPTRQKELLTRACDQLTADAAIELLEAARSEHSKTVSDSMIRVLTKLARHAEVDSPARQGAAEAVRDHMRRMVAEWELENPNAEDYDEALKRMATGTPLVRMDTKASSAFDAERVTQMCLELDVTGESLRQALEEMIETDLVGTLLTLLDEVPSHIRAGEVAWTQLASPGTIRHLTDGDLPRFEWIDRLLERMGVSAAGPLLDALADSQSRSIRWKLLERLEAIGEELGPLLVERLDDPSWYVVRNMLTLLGAIPALPPGFSPEPYVAHEHEMVRLEALKLCVSLPDLRDRAVIAALSETNDRLVSLGLAEAEKDCPGEAGEHIRRIARDPLSASVLRASAARILSRLRTAADLEILLGLLPRRRRFLRRDASCDGHPHVVAAVRALGEGWPSDPRVRRALSGMSRSSDPDIRLATADPSSTKVSS